MVTASELLAKQKEVAALEAEMQAAWKRYNDAQIEVQVQRELHSAARFDAEQAARELKQLEASISDSATS